MSSINYLIISRSRLKFRSFDGTEYLLSTEANRNHLEELIDDYGHGNVRTSTIQEFQNKYKGLAE